jgi:hypothetical protein
LEKERGFLLPIMQIGWCFILTRIKHQNKKRIYAEVVDTINFVIKTPSVPVAFYTAIIAVFGFLYGPI